MNLRGIRYVDQPRQACWELPPHPLGPDGTYGLLGWELKTRPVEAGVDPDAARILLRALCAGGALIFPSSLNLDEVATFGWRQESDVWQCPWTVPAPGRWPRGIPARLVQTNAPDTAQSLFHDPVFSWDQRAQWAGLIPPGSKPGADEITVANGVARWVGGFGNDLVFESTWDALMVPGVDGDFAALFYLGPDGRTDILRRLGEECRKESVPWRVCSEKDFMSAPWIG